jgi:hypothetical protein
MELHVDEDERDVMAEPSTTARGKAPEMKESGSKRPPTRGPSSSRLEQSAKRRKPVLDSSDEEFEEALRESESDEVHVGVRMLCYCALPPFHFRLAESELGCVRCRTFPLNWRSMRRWTKFLPGGT